MPPMILTLPNGEPIANYSFDDEAMHAPGEEQNWQESVAMWWFDVDTRMGGFMRIGHEPRMDGGNMTLWSFLQTPDWLYTPLPCAPAVSVTTAMTVAPPSGQ